MDWIRNGLKPIDHLCCLLFTIFVRLKDQVIIICEPG